MFDFISGFFSKKNKGLGSDIHVLKELAREGTELAHRKQYFAATAVFKLFL